MLYGALQHRITTQSLVPYIEGFTAASLRTKKNSHEALRALLTAVTDFQSPVKQIYDTFCGLFG